jgi:phosphoglycolate phosphatase
VTRFPLILFDLDGTLVDSFGDICAGIEKACAEIGIRADADLLRLATRGVPLEDFYRAAAGADPHGSGEAARFVRFVDAYRAHYLPACTQTTVPYPGVVETLRALRGLSPRPVIAVATTKRTWTAERVLEGTGLHVLVDVIAGSDGLPPKPDPAVLARAAARAGVELSRSVMVGDTDRDVGAARAAGCACVGVTWGGFSAEEMAALAPDWRIDRIEALLPIVDSGYDKRA